MAKRREEYFKDKCCSCGSVDQLELDHIDPTRKVSHRIWSWSNARREAELAKCQPLCSACHLKKTIKSKLSTTHGTQQMYQKYKCRCDECKQYKSLDNAKRAR